MSDFLTREQVAILLELRELAKHENLNGEKLVTIMVPRDIFDRLLILGLPSMANSSPPPAYGPRKIIGESTEKTVAEYIKANPEHQGSEHLRWIRIAAENKAIIDFLQGLYERGKL